MKKLTEAEFAERVLESGKDIVLVEGTFKATKQNADFKCTRCGTQFTMIARNILKEGSGCPGCKSDNRADNFSEYIKEKSNGEFEVIEYGGYGNRSIIKHNICGKTFDADTKTFRENVNCPLCGHNHRLSQEEFLERVKDTWGDEYEVIGKYISMGSPVEVKHKICNHVWFPKANNLIRGHGCPKCANNQKKDTVDIKEKVKELTEEEYEFIGEYINVHEKALFVHHNCPSNDCKDFEFMTEPNGFINAGQRCPKCAGTMQLTHEEFVSRVKEQVGEEYTVLGQYVNMHTKLLMRHNSCKCEYYVKPHSFVGKNKCRCPQCYESKGERSIHDELSKRNINFKTQYKFNDCIYKRELPFDFAIFDKNNKLYCLIEFDGGQHFQPINFLGGKEAYEIRKIRDNIKDEYCKKNNIKLIRIPYFDIDEIPEIIQNIYNDLNQIC